ncbi:MAG: hypothetical protein RSA86_03970 [Christensenellaceae bacterium]
MMYSDYFTLSTCAFSILFVPFLVIAQIRFAHVMQEMGYDNKRYLSWIKRHFKAAMLPLIVICGLTILSAVVLQMYLEYNPFYEINVIIYYLLVLVILSAVLAFVFYKYVKKIKIESDIRPIICEKRLVHNYLLCCLMICAITLLVNAFIKIDKLVFVIMLATPFFMPLANLITSLKKASVSE